MTDIPPPDDADAPPPDDAVPPPHDNEGALARRTPCRFCKAEVFLARCDDGHWRTFDLPDCEPTIEGVWVWHKRHGMQEYVRFGRPAHPGETLVPGKRLHYCAERSIAKMHIDLGGSPTPAERPVDKRPRF